MLLFQNLKSNMDRFIEFLSFLILNSLFYLKSNMDRFIGLGLCKTNSRAGYLKSNMDRFIARHPYPAKTATKI